MEPEEADKQSGETLTRDFLTRKAACFGCPIACGRLTKMKSKDYAGEGPEYETIWAFAGDCGIAELEPAIEANYICNELGIDTIGAGTTIAAAMELYEKGYLPKEDLEGGPEMKFGNAEAMLYWTRAMGLAKGKLGKLLAEGSYRLCEHYGHPELSMSVKKQEMPAYDGRGIQGIGLTYATSNRGGCHVRGYTNASEIAGLPFKSDPYATEGKPELAKIFQDLTAAIDSAGLCLFTSFALGADDYAELLKGGMGWDITGEEVMCIGERVWNLEKLYNIREGWTPEDDELPKRLTDEPIPNGPSKGLVSQVPAMLPVYYEKRGWDANGHPTKERLEKLGL
jgi:aldehyde:ferredoxin oxidoreductase